LLPAPLKRLTPLREDPAAEWLTAAGRFAVTVRGSTAWVAYGLFIAFEWLCARYALGTLLGLGSETLMFIPMPNVPVIVAAATAIALYVPTRRAVIALESSATGAKARATALRQALAVDDLAALGAEPDGRVVSLVGWVRGHAYLQQPVDGKRAVGLTLRCQDTYPFVLEILQNFDLVGEMDDEALVVTVGGRLLGKTNVRLQRGGYDDKVLVSSLDLPMTAILTDWNAFVVRDGDPVMVVGTKTTIQDLAQARGRATARVAVASAPSRPLLVFPLAAERRDV
jgi:hypothetical protein